METMAVIPANEAGFEWEYHRADRYGSAMSSTKYGKAMISALKAFIQ